MLLPWGYVVNITAADVDLVAFGWVKNADWFRARSDLNLKLVDAFLGDDRIGLSLPQQEVFVMPVDNTTDSPVSS